MKKGARKEEKIKQPLGRVMRNNLMMLRIIYQAYPTYLILLVFETIKNRCLIFVEHTWGIQFVLQAAEFHRPFRDVAVYLIGITIILMLNMTWSSFFDQYFAPKGIELSNKKLKMMLYEKAMDIDLARYDDPSYYNDFVLSIAESEKCLQRATENLRMACDGITMLITSGAFVMVNDSVSVVFVLVSFLLQMIFSQRLNKIIYRLRLKVNPSERKRNYIHRVFYLNEYAKEIRLNPEVSNQFSREFKEANDEIYTTNKKIGRKRMWTAFAGGYLSGSFIFDTCYLIYLVFKAAVLHLISYSTVIVLSNAAYGFRFGMQSVADLLPKLSENSMYVQKLVDFMACEKKVVSRQGLPTPKENTVLELRNVSFAYQEGQPKVLSNISMVIHPLEKIALVGYNGAGKTTLIKLIMRLYDPTEGQILLNGVDIRDYDMEDYREKIGAVFQDYKIYGATVEENVFMDNIEAETVRPAVLRSLEQSGFKERLAELKYGLQTPLTTEFEEEGVNLSGGEAQKVAIARVFYRSSELMILDEPSSALDPIAEYRLNGTMLEAAEHKTVVFISHRLSTTRDADKIYMMEEGRIIEQGTHTQLLALNGKYAAMWRVQAGQYAEELPENER